MNTIVCPPIYCIDEYPMYIEHTRIIISEPIHKIFMVFIVFTWLNYTDSVCSYLKHSSDPVHCWVSKQQLWCLDFKYDDSIITFQIFQFQKGRKIIKK